MPHYTTFIYLGLISMGIGLGTYGTLIGAGGGFLLMPLLLFIYPNEHHHTLTAISFGLAGHFFAQGVHHVLKVRILADLEDRVSEEMRRDGVSAERHVRSETANDVFLSGGLSVCRPFVPGCP